MTADRLERVTQTTVADPVAAPSRVTTREESESKISGGRLVARVIRFITAVIISLLALRFVLLLLGASQASGFVEFIVDITSPLVTPFEGIFGNPTEVRFEPQTLTAIVVYGLVGAALSYLARIKQTRTN